MQAGSKPIKVAEPVASNAQKAMARAKAWLPSWLTVCPCQSSKKLRLTSLPGAALIATDTINEVPRRRRSWTDSDRICQDLEARLGIAQGKVAPPDYRDYLADLIEERYGSRYRFCKATGVDPGHLSRVFASQSQLSLQSLQRILDALHAALVIQPEEDLAERISPERAARDLAGAGR